MLFRKGATAGLAGAVILAAGIQQPVLADPASTGAGSSPAGYVTNGGTPQAQDSDYRTQQWAAANCQADKRANATSGAVIGGLLGAAAGVGLSGRHGQAAGAILGGAGGAVAGGAIGSGSTPASCLSAPASYRVSPAYYAPPPVYYPPVAYPGYPPVAYRGVVYGAPGWYNPWFWAGGWVYRPYPVHYFYRPYHRW